MDPLADDPYSASFMHSPPLETQSAAHRSCTVPSPLQGSGRGAGGPPHCTTSAQLAAAIIAHTQTPPDAEFQFIVVPSSNDEGDAGDVRSVTSYAPRDDSAIFIDAVSLLFPDVDVARYGVRWLTVDIGTDGFTAFGVCLDRCRDGDRQNIRVERWFDIDCKGDLVIFILDADEVLLGDVTRYRDFVDGETQIDRRSGVMTGLGLSALRFIGATRVARFFDGLFE